MGEPAKPEDNTTDKKAAVEPEENIPVVKELKEVDDKYLALEREYDKEVEKLRAKYDEMQKPFLEERAKILQQPPSDGGTPESATPALPDFWMQALRNHPHLVDFIEDHDEPVLRFLKDIRCDHLNESNLADGFKLIFEFTANPYFSNSELTKEFHLQEPDPYTQDVDVLEIKASEIQWKPGQDVTVEKTTKKVKGGGAKKAKQKGSVKEEPRSSFFRTMFRSLKKDGAFPEDARLDPDWEEDDEEDDETMLDFVIENAYDAGKMVKMQIIPYAVRWYTGEAAPEDDDDEDEEDEEADDDDDDDDDEDEEDDDAGPAAKPTKGKAKAKPPKKDAGKGAEQQECKTQ